MTQTWAFAGEHLGVAPEEPEEAGAGLRRRIAERHLEAWFTSSAGRF